MYLYCLSLSLSPQSLTVDQAGLELAIFLPLPAPECWDHRHVPDLSYSRSLIMSSRSDKDWPKIHYNHSTNVGTIFKTLIRSNLIINNNKIILKEYSTWNHEKYIGSFLQPSLDRNVIAAHLRARILVYPCKWKQFCTMKNNLKYKQQWYMGMLIWIKSYIVGEEFSGKCCSISAKIRK